ncbi:MAG: 50S ribosomal protein L32 [Clostridia bacterium]|nr:50S ribosomal protein L32 [Clostridia bacterium]
MGVPKRRQSHSRKNKRRSQWRKTTGPTLTECPQCHEMRLSHTMCPSCGYYKGKAVAGDQ